MIAITTPSILFLEGLPFLSYLYTSEHIPTKGLWCIIAHEYP